MILYDICLVKLHFWFLSYKNEHFDPLNYKP